MSSNIELLKSYISRNPTLSDSDISIRLGVATKSVKKARESICSDIQVNEVKNKVISNNTDNPDVVLNPAESLKIKLRQLDQAFDVSRKEFLLDPNSDNAYNMTQFLLTIKQTLKELDTFTDFTALSDRIVSEVLVELTKQIMTKSYECSYGMIKELSGFLPKSIKYKVDEFPTEFYTSIGKESKDIYNNALDKLQEILNIDLSKYRTKESDKKVKAVKRIRNK
jgi:hypothetical protein